MTFVSQRFISYMQFPRWVLAGALLLGVMTGMLLPRLMVKAQAMEPQTYTVIAGDGTLYNTQVLAFAPQSLQVHRGDTIVWRITGGFHNVHFEEQPTDLVIDIGAGFLTDGTPVNIVSGEGN